jgi:hypothetical protein
MCTFRVLLEHALHEWHFGQLDVELPHHPQDGVYLGDHLLATTDGVVVGLVEIASSCIEKLNEAVGGELRDHLVGVLLGDVQLVVLHGS